ncbi:MAG: DUF2207 family protein [Actinomycetota bacterium]
MLDPVGKMRHVLVGASVLAAPALVGLGVLGGGVHPERFEAKQVVVTPAGDGVRIREVVDHDFGHSARHGYERVIPNDFGAATDVVASSPDAPGELSVVDEGSQTRIRIGDPSVTVDGQHRYVLEYTLPMARLTSGQLALDIIGTDETLETGRFEVVLSGFDLGDPTCNVGSFGTSGGCTLVEGDGLYRAVIEPLRPGQGITVGGAIRGTATPASVPEPALPERRDDERLPLAAGSAALGAAAAIGGFRYARRLGRNEVGGSTTADAAFANDDGPTRLVTDRELQGMATTEFEPPRGLRPWHGALLLNERVDNNSVSAWFSDQIAQEVISLTGEGNRTVVQGPKFAQAPQVVRERVQRMFAGGDQLTLGSYVPELGLAWRAVDAEQRAFVRESGWWKKFPPGSVASFPASYTFGFLAVLAAVAVGVWRGFLHAWPLAIGVSLLIPTLAARSAYHRLLPVRSAKGSAVALRAESFRRFLQASEGSHVDWAWKHGLLRDYSAWAVALGAADAWGRAVAASAVPPPEVAAGTMSIWVYANAAVWNSTMTKPQPTGGGSGGGFGGFSGGSVGVGGGGGSSGSW